MRWLALYQHDWRIFKSENESSAWRHAQNHSSRKNPLIDLSHYTGLVGASDNNHRGGS